ncbi:MAG TPA: single-stranded DNA-binding protein [Candidatus Peribacteria bacterium]|nr:single-stranded DNA-binding protein [Candidatus Peribacteria bacterium]
MFSLNRIEIIGYQTQPVSLRQTPGGTSVTDLNIVVPYTFQSGKGETLSGKSFHTVTVWGSMADVAGQYVRPGSQMYISGRLQTDSWEDEQSGEKRSKTKVVAMDMILLDPKGGQTEVPASAAPLTQCINRVQVIGNITRDPEMRTTTSGQNVLSFGVATNERWKDKASGEMKERTEFHNVVAWGELAVAIQANVKKGQRVYACGRVQTRSFETQAGQKRYTTEVIADQVSMLGIKNADAVAAISADGAAMPARSSAPASAPRAASQVEREAVGVGASIPDIKYESEIKPEDLPF